MSITKLQYFGEKTPPIAHEANAEWLLTQANCLLHRAALEGVYDYWIDNDTGSQISGSKGGSGDGGYRLSNASTGAPGSSHKEGKGVDIYDPNNNLDDWITDEVLAEFGLYREHPEHTKGWVHLTTRPPRSKRRTFIP